VLRLSRGSGCVQDRVLVAELPGHADWGLGDPCTIAGVSAAILEGLRGLGIRELAVVGHSLGGYRALHLAASADVRVTRVVTLGGFADLADLRKNYPALADMAEQGSAPVANVIRPRLFAPGFSEREPERAAEVHAYTADMDPASLAAQLRTVSIVEDLRPSLPKVQARVLACHGTEDLIVPPTFSEDIVAGVKGAELRRLSGVEHFPLFEDQETTVALIEGALTAR
jgi:pimeloyl-ACP methyl ester carboxylesterase